MGDAAKDLRKHELRAQFKAIRKALDPAERVCIDDEIAKQVLALDEYRVAKLLLAYLSFGSEIETRGIIEDAWRKDKTVALPWCVPHTREMRWFRITNFDDLVKSSFGVLEPVPSQATELYPHETAQSVALVPGLTFDLRGYRMGYGGGFYDSFLADFTGISVGLCREAQLSVDGVEALDAHDLPVQMVVTEKRVIKP